ncbi:MAG: hypothetical protein ABL872_19780, partial [Lacibacter sp.]
MLKKGNPVNTNKVFFAFVIPLGVKPNAETLNHSAFCQTEISGRPNWRPAKGQQTESKFKNFQYLKIQKWYAI